MIESRRGARILREGAGTVDHAVVARQHPDPERHRQEPTGAGDGDQPGPPTPTYHGRNDSGGPSSYLAHGFTRTSDINRDVSGYLEPAALSRHIMS